MTPYILPKDKTRKPYAPREGSAAYLIILALEAAEKAGKRLTVEELSKATGLSKEAVSSNLTPLKARGVVDHRRDWGLSKGEGVEP